MMLEIIKEYMDETKTLLETFQKNLSTLNEITKANMESMNTMVTTLENLHKRVKALETIIN